MNVSIPPPFEVEVTPVSLIFVIGVAQALLIAVALWRKPFASQRMGTSPGRTYNPNRFLVALIALFGLLFLENFVFLTGYLYYLFNYIPAPVVQFVFGAQNFLFGPLLYFYTKSMVQPGSLKYNHYHLLHLLPFIIFTFLRIPAYLADTDARLVDIYEDYYLSGYLSEPTIIIDGFFGSSVIFDLGDYNEILRYEFKSLLGVWWIYFEKVELQFISLAVSYLVYTALSLYSLRAHRVRLSLVVSSMDSIELTWLKRVLQLCMLAAIVFVLQNIAVRFLYIRSMANPLLAQVPNILLVALVFYIAYKALRQPQIFSAELAEALRALETPAEEKTTADSLFQGEQVNPDSMEKPAPSGIEQKKSKYQNSPLSPELSESLANDLRRHIETDKPHLNSRLTLPQLASEVGLSTHMLSQLLNETIDQNFFDFINSYRVKEAQRLLHCADSDGKTILEIGTECGFNSNSAFYNAFKKHAGVTPSQWRKPHKSSENRDIHHISARQTP